MFEVEKDSRFDLLKFLAKEAALAPAQPHKTVGDRLVEAAPHQQPQVGAALLPFKGGAGQGGEEGQAVTSAGEPEFQPALVGVQGDLTHEGDVAFGALGPQGQVQLDNGLPQLNPAPLQGDWLGTNPGLIQGQVHHQFGMGPSQSVGALEAEAAAQAPGHRGQ